MKALSTVIHYQTTNELPDIATRLMAMGKSVPVWLFHGGMGVGKTTLIKALCAVQGVHNTVQSPTFSIVNEYVAGTGEPIFHFDCYRLKNETEAYDIGAEEYLYSGHRCFVEWPERIESLWPETYMNIQMTLQPDGGRVIVATAERVSSSAPQ